MVEDRQHSRVAGKVRWSTLPFAGWSGRKVGLSINDGWGITIPKSSKYPREAFEFASWCIDKEKQVKLVLETQVSPTRSSVFERSELRDRFIWFPVMKEQLANLFDFPILPEWAEVLEKVGAELHAGWAGQYPMPKALDRANQLVTDLLKERKYPVGAWTGPSCLGSESSAIVGARGGNRGVPSRPGGRACPFHLVERGGSQATETGSVRDRGTAIAMITPCVLFVVFGDVAK
jgi:hypothetical protein